MSDKLHRMVSGVRVELTDAEEAETRAGWAANETAQQERASAEVKQAIITQLRENDIKAIRALTEGDTARVNAHKAAQATLRAQLK